MGFKRPTTLVDFSEGHQFHGLEARCKLVSFERMLEIQEFLATLPDGETETTAADTKRQLQELATMFGEVLAGWNLEEDDGTAIPATATQLAKEGWELVISLVMQWIQTVSNVDQDLGKGSPGGGPSPVESIPMDVLSGSPSS